MINMASGRYIDMEKTERLRKESLKDSLERAKAANDSLHKSTAANDSALVQTAKKRGFLDKMKKKIDKKNAESSDLVNSSSSRKEP